MVKSKNVPPPQVVHKDEEEETESDHGEDLRQMIEPEDLEFIKSSIIEGSYSLFKGKNFTRYEYLHILKGFVVILSRLRLVYF